MSVNVGQRNIPDTPQTKQCYAVDACMEFALHTQKICKNHKKKTHIRPLSKGFTFLGFAYHMTDTGKIIMTLNSENVKHERKKLYRLVQKCKRGETTKRKVDECYNSWKSFASEGNSKKLLQRMDKYYKSLWR